MIPGSAETARVRAAVIRLARRVLPFVIAGAGASSPAQPPPSTAPGVLPEALRPQFVEVGEQSGLTTVQYCGGVNRDHLLESTGTGAGFIDYDDDGWLDVVLPNAWRFDEAAPARGTAFQAVNHGQDARATDASDAIAEKGRLALYRNLGDGEFQNVAAAAGVDDDSWGCGVCAGDYDNDGHVDFYVTNFGPNRLYRNRGDGTFEEGAEHAGVGEPSWGGGCAFFDADKDGDLDLYLANYVDCKMEDVLNARRTLVYRETVKVMVGPFGMRGARDRFYRNDGDGTFTDATVEAGMEDVAEAYGLGVLASDLDLDGDIDVYVANDSNANYLYRNEGNGTFTELGMLSGAGLSAQGAAQAGMGVDGDDFDGDGLPDIIVTNFANDHSTYYRNTGDLFFEDMSSRLKLPQFTHPLLSWGCAFFDYDHDMDLDVFIVSGHIYPQVDAASLNESYAQPPLLLEQADGTTKDVTADRGPGLRVKRSMRGLAVGDYDNDGDLDLLVTAIDSRPLLLRNDGGNARHWVQLRLLSGSPARDALGARATVTAGGRTQTRELRSGSTYQSQNAFRLHFGLGDSRVIERIEVLWPDGTRTIRQNVPANQILTLKPDTGTGQNER